MYPKTEGLFTNHPLGKQIVSPRGKTHTVQIILYIL